MPQSVGFLVDSGAQRCFIDKEDLGLINKSKPVGEKIAIIPFNPITTEGPEAHRVQK